MKTTDSGKQQLEAAADRDELLLLIEEINNQEQGEAGEDLDDDDSASLGQPILIFFGPKDYLYLPWTLIQGP